MLWQPGEEYKDKYVLTTVKHGGGNVMVWGCMSAAGDIMKQSMTIPSLGRLGRRAVFQHDNDHCLAKKAEGKGDGLVVVAVSQQYIVIFSTLLRQQDTGLTHSKYLYLMLNCQICKINMSYLLLWLLSIDRQGYIQILRIRSKRISRFPLRPIG